MRWLVLLIVASSCPAQADEMVELVDKTRIVGKFLHFYDGTLTLKLPNGTRMRLPTAKVKRINFKMPKPRKALSTPAKSFKRLRTAALRGDIDTYVDTHSTYYQMLLNHQVQLATPAKFIKRLKKEWGAAKLNVIGTKIDGAVAVIKVRRKQGQQSEEGEMRFVRENSEWKMILPL